MGQATVPSLNAAMGQTTAQPMETPLNTGWEFSQYGQIPASTTSPQAFTPNPHAAAASTWPG
eukprot:5956092-Prorocentrum_lima.AAC.1